MKKIKFKDLSDNDKLSANIKFLFEKDFKYNYQIIESEYKSEYTNDDQYSTITGYKVKSVNIIKLIEFISNKIEDKIILYSIDRAVRASNVTTAAFEVTIDQGYYGDELGSIKLISEQLLANLHGLLDKTNLDRIKYVLELEYGYLLPEIDRATKLDIRNGNPKAINIGQQDHYRKLNKQVIDAYKDYDLPRCICLSNKNGLRLIDGYHRLHSANNQKLDNIDVILLIE